MKKHHEIKHRFFLISLCIITLGLGWEEVTVAQIDASGSIFDMPNRGWNHTPNWAKGQKSHLVVRFRYSDLNKDLNPNINYSDAAIRAVMEDINAFYIRNSYSKVSYPRHLLDIIPGTLSVTSTGYGYIDQI